MNKILIYLLCTFVFTQGFTQAITKGNILVNTGVGFGIGSVKTSIDSSESTTAVPGLLHITAGYAITDDFSAGIRLERNGYVSDKEDSSKITSINPSLVLTYNFVNNETFTFYSALDIGTSSLTFTSERPEDVKNNVTLKGKSGVKWGIDLGLNSYFSDNVGLFFTAGYASYSYNKLTYHNDSGDPKDWTFTEDGTLDGTPAKLIFGGVNIRTGIALKF